MFGDVHPQFAATTAVHGESDDVAHGGAGDEAAFEGGREAQQVPEHRHGRRSR